MTNPGSAAFLQFQGHFSKSGVHVSSQSPQAPDGKIAPAAIDWSDPPMSPEGDEDAESIFTEVGRALSTWEMVEDALAILFSRFCSGARGEGVVGVAGRTFGAVPAGNTRKNMLEEAAEIYTAYENQNFDLPGFKSLLKHYGQASGARARIAHGMVRQIFTDGESRGYFLAPAGYKSNANWRVDEWLKIQHEAEESPHPWWKYRYRAADIASFCAKFQELEILFSRVHGQEMIGRMMVRMDMMTPSSPATGPK